MRLRLLAIVAILLALVIFTWYQLGQRTAKTGTEESPALEPANKKIRVGILPIADCGQYFVALDRKLFASRNLEVEAITFDGGAKIIGALAAGDLDVGFSNFVSIILARDSQIPLVILTGGPAEDSAHPEHALIALKNSKLASVGDLNGKRIGINTRKNIDELMVRLLLEKSNVDADSVAFQEVPFPRMLGALTSGSIDAAAAIEPFVTIAKDDPNIVVVSYHYPEVRPTVEISAYVTLASKTRTEEISLFVDAIQEATAIIQANPGVLREILPKYTKLTVDQAGRMILPRFTDRPAAESLEWFIAILKDKGWLQRTDLTAAELKLNPVDSK